jgi:hypothetical protein
MAQLALRRILLLPCQGCHCRSSCCCALLQLLSLLHLLFDQHPTAVIHPLLTVRPTWQPLPLLQLCSCCRKHCWACSATDGCEWPYNPDVSQSDVKVRLLQHCR